MAEAKFDIFCPECNKKGFIPGYEGCPKCQKLLQTRALAVRMLRNPKLSTYDPRYCVGDDRKGDYGQKAVDALARRIERQEVDLQEVPDPPSNYLPDSQKISKRALEMGRGRAYHNGISILNRS